MSLFYDAAPLASVGIPPVPEPGLKTGDYTRTEFQNGRDCIALLNERP